MRIDKRLQRQGLTTRQICFIECWGSLSHEDSLDTDRVSFNNILNAINEILALYPQGRMYKGVKKRLQAAEELVHILKEDAALGDPVFQGIPARILHLLDYKDAWTDTGRSPVEQSKGFIQNIFMELRSLLLEHYIPVNVALLQQEIAKTTPVQQQDLACIVSVCNNIMSFMLTAGIPLGECSLIYSRILLDRQRTFSNRLSSWTRKVNISEQSFTVAFTLESDKLYDMLTVADTPTVFNGCVYTPLVNGHGRKAMRVDVSVKAYSFLAAKETADIRLRDSLDVVAYMLGSGKINKHQRFSITDTAGGVKGFEGFSYEILTNSDRLTKKEFSRFMGSMSSLYSKSSVTSARKVTAAFRFLRSGLDNKDSKENRFSAYWSALESLTLQVSSAELDHDDHVAYTTPACMGFDYVIKQLIAIRGIANQLGLNIAQQNGTVVSPGNMSLHDIYLSLKDPIFLQNIEQGMVDYPYALFTVQKFATLCHDPRKMGQKIISHAAKVNRHLYRLYSLRNAIAHNAESNPYIKFLTANLEHYLRGTITAMFYTSSMIGSVNSPESSFQRYLDFYEVALNQLEPTYARDEKEHKQIDNNVKASNIVPADDELQKWIALHQ